MEDAQTIRDRLWLRPRPCTTRNGPKSIQPGTIDKTASFVRLGTLAQERTLFVSNPLATREPGPTLSKHMVQSVWPRPGAGGTRSKGFAADRVPWITKGVPQPAGRATASNCTQGKRHAGESPLHHQRQEARAQYIGSLVVKAPPMRSKLGPWP